MVLRRMKREIIKYGFAHNFLENLTMRPIIQIAFATDTIIKMLLTSSAQAVIFSQVELIYHHKTLPAFLQQIFLHHQGEFAIFLLDVLVAPIL